MARRVMMLLAIASLGVLALAFAGCGGSDKSAATTETTAAHDDGDDHRVDDGSHRHDGDRHDRHRDDRHDRDDGHVGGLGLRNVRELPGVRGDRAEDLERAQRRRSDLEDVAKAFHQYADAVAGRHQGGLPDARGLVRQVAG